MRPRPRDPLLRGGGGVRSEAGRGMPEGGKIVREGPASSNDMRGGAGACISSSASLLNPHLPNNFALPAEEGFQRRCRAHEAGGGGHRVRRRRVRI
jgi:hypothetical protein